MRSILLHSAMMGLLAAGLVGCESEKKESQTQSPPPAKTTPPAESPAPVKPAPAVETPPPAKPAPLVISPTPAPTTQPSQASNQVIVDTSMGAITIELTPDTTPITVDNFLKYVDAKFYDGTIFHRVIPNFMIQGGGFTSDLTEKPTREKIKNESSKAAHNTRGTISMARTNDPDSATAQFFINLKDNPNLDFQGSGGYAVFGKVVSGMDVVDQIAGVQTVPSPLGTPQDPPSLPQRTVEIRTIRRK